MPRAHRLPREAEIDAEVARELGPPRDAVRLLRSIPGVSDLSAQAIIAAIGTADRRSGTGHMGRFPIAGHLVSWVGLCPRSDESPSKRRFTRPRKGAPWLKTALAQCAWTASNKEDSYLRAQFQRLRQKRGPKKAVCPTLRSDRTQAARATGLQRSPER